MTEQPQSQQRFQGQYRRVIYESLVIVLFIGITLFQVREWILAPLNSGIGTYDAESELIGTDAALSLSFSGWMKFAIVELGQYPLAHSEYLMAPAGASHGRSFDGLLLAIITFFFNLFLPLVFSFSLALSLGLFLNGYMTYWHARRLFGRNLIAPSLGVCAMFMTYMSSRFDVHANLTYIWVLPLTLHLAHNLAKKPTLKRTILWSLSFPLLALSSWYVLIMGMVYQIAMTAVLLGLNLKSWRDKFPLFGKLLGGWALGLFLIFIVGNSMILAHGERQTFTIDTMITYSASISRLLLPNQFGPLGQVEWIAELHNSGGASWEAAASLPIIALLLLPLAFSGPAPRFYKLFLAIALFGAFALTVGPYIYLHDVRTPENRIPFVLYVLGNISVAFNQVRIPGRMVPSLIYPLLFASGYGLLSLYRILSKGIALRIVRVLCIVTFTAINIVWTGTFFAFRTFPLPEVSSFYHELAENPGEGSVFDVPFSNYYFPHYGVYQFTHKRPIVSATLFHDALEGESLHFLWSHPATASFCDFNGNFINEHHINLVTAPEFWERLDKNGVEYVVVHARTLSYIMNHNIGAPGTLAHYAEVERRWADRLVFHDDLIRVYGVKIDE